MTPAKAKVIFATHMQAARKRKLTSYELNQLSTARQVLRQQRKPAMNPGKGAFGWPLVPSKRFPKEESLSCPRCGSTDVVLSTYGKLGDPQSGNTIRCKKCGLSDSKPARNPKKARRNAPRNGVLIYGNVQRIYATKTQQHLCDDDCKAHGHRYYHDFTSKPKMYGLPDGSLLIKK